MGEYFSGLGTIEDLSGFIKLETGGDNSFHVGKDGVIAILTPLDKKTEFIIFEDKVLCYVKSSMGYPALYPLKETKYKGFAKAVLMDLDGTSVHSESFWIWIIEQTMARLLKNPKFSLAQEDEPFVSGHSVSEHLQYCINKYCGHENVETARRHYYDITNYEMNEILCGRGKKDAFTPAPGLKEFLYTLKEKSIKIGLVTSGLYQKAMPEIVSAFRSLNMGDPLDFYDAVITAGTAIIKGQAGTMGELAPKPHPWLYAETARVGLGMDVCDNEYIIGLEDSAAGVVSIKLAGFAPIGIAGGNIKKSGTYSLCMKEYDNLCDVLPLL